MPQVFISYARQDFGFVETRILPLLKAMNLGFWIDQEDLHASDVWEKRIEGALRVSDWYILVMSEKAAASRNVRKEADWILSNRQDRLFPVLYSDCRPADIDDRLPEIHYIDFVQNPDRLKVRLLRSLLQSAFQQSQSATQKVTELSAEIEALAEERDELQAEVHGLTAQLHDVAEFDGDWTGEGPHPVPRFVPRAERNAPIVSVLNLKGGVGKSTLAVNLAAMFFKRQDDPKRVLLVDLDFQMSATSLCLHRSERKDAIDARLSSSRLLEPGVSAPVCLFQCAKRVGHSQGFVVPADDGLTRCENKALAQWLTGETPRDVRFLLREVLHAPEVQEKFDLILLDCPPRLHASAINALAASDFVLVPVLLDLTSSDSVPRLLAWLSRFREDGLSPDLEILGVVANKKSSHRKDLLIREENVWNKLGATCQGEWEYGEAPLLKSIIPESSAISDAAETPGRFACEDAKVRLAFEKLVKEIEPRLFVRKEVSQP